MTASVSQTPEAARIAAQDTLKKRDDGIRAQAIGEGRRLERTDMLKALGVQKLEEASTCAQLRAERDERPTREQYGRHGMARLAQGGFIGLMLGAVFFAWLTMFVIVPMNEQTRASTEAGVMIGTAASVHGVQPVVTRPEQ